MDEGALEFGGLGLDGWHLRWFLLLDLDGGGGQLGHHWLLGWYWRREDFGD